MRFRCTLCSRQAELPGARSTTLAYCSDPACSGTLESLETTAGVELALVTNGREGTRVPLTRGMLLGSHAACSLRVDQPGVAPRHAEIDGDPGEWVLFDLESADGTFVNGTRIVQKQLADGDRIRLGTAEIVFHSVAGQAAGHGTGVLHESNDGRELSGASQSGSGGVLKMNELEAAATSRGPYVKAMLASAAFAVAPDEPVLLEKILDGVFAVFPAERAAVLVLRHELRKQRVVARMRDGKPLDEFMAMSRSLAKKVLEEKLAMVVLDAASDPRMPNVASVIVKGLRSILVAPLMIDDRVLGLLWADSRVKTGAFKNEDLPVFAGLAAAAGGALEAVRQATSARHRSLALSRLAQAMPDEMIPQIMTRRVTMPIDGEQREITALFSDLRGFTMEADRMAAADVVQMLNGYFGRMAEVVNRHGGMLDKFVGDSVMAFWGMPVAKPDDPSRATAAAFAMQAELARINQESVASGRPALAMGIGIHTGQATVGSIGSPARMEWSAVGGTVKLVTRLGSIAAGGEVQVTGATQLRIAGKYATSPLPENPALPGVALHRVLGENPRATESS